MDGYVPNNPNVDVDVANWQWFSPLRQPSSTSPEPGPVPGALPPCPSPSLLHQLSPFDQFDCSHDFERVDSTVFAPLPNVHTLNSGYNSEDVLLQESLAADRIDGFLSPMKPAETAALSVDSNITGYDSPYHTAQTAPSQWCSQPPSDNNQLPGAMQSYSLPDQHLLHGISVNVGVSMNIGHGGGYQPYLTEDSSQLWYGDPKSFDSGGALLQPPMTSPFSSTNSAALPSSSIACYSAPHDQRLDTGGFYNNNPAYSMVNNQCAPPYPAEGGVYGHYDNSQPYACKSDTSNELVDKSNVCRICGKAYARPSTLKTHMRTHSGERPYRCHQCCKSFSQAANLTAHVRTHSGEKPFRCPICDRRFSQSSSVTTHMRTHSGDRPYRCRMCKKSFSDSSTLTKHMRIHSGEKPYQCKVCMLRFSQSGNLNRHMRVHSSQYC